MCVTSQEGGWTEAREGGGSLWLSEGLPLHPWVSVCADVYRGPCRAHLPFHLTFVPPALFIECTIRRPPPPPRIKSIGTGQPLLRQVTRATTFGILAHLNK